MNGYIGFLLHGKPKFCKECGEELQLTERPSKYDAKTGKPKRIHVAIICPDFEWLYVGTRSDGEEVYRPNGHVHFYYDRKAVTADMLDCLPAEPPSNPPIRESAG